METQGNKPKRENGTGSITKRKDGRWVARIQTGKNEKGKPKIESFYGSTEAEVKKKLKEFITNLSKYDNRVIVKTTVNEFIGTWMKDIEFYSLKPKSYDISEMIIEKFINPAIGNLQVGTLTTIDIQSIVNDMIKRGLSYSSIKKVYNILNKRFKLAMVRREVFYNPVLGVKLPQNLIRDISDIVFFNDEQIEKICKEAVREHGNGKPIYRLGQAVIFLLYTGVRIGEALALDLEDPNLVQKSLPINKNVVTIKNRNKKSETDNEYITIIQPSPKTKASNRIVPLIRKARIAVIELQKLNAGHPTLISTSTGKIPSAKTIDRMFRSILRKCDIQEEGIHTLRHTFASLLFRKKVDVKTVSEILGHASVAITYSTYIHLINEQKAEALDLLDDEDDSIEVTSDYSI